MKISTNVLLVPYTLLLLAGCSQPTVPASDDAPAASSATQTSPPPASPSTTQPAPEPVAVFEDRVWRVAESSAVAPGTLYLFRSNGKLEITSPGSNPMIGTWSRKGDGLEMVEESIPYQVDILSLKNDSFVIRSHNPGEPVDISMVPVAEGAGSKP
jgi:hypothetical protein